MTGVDEVVAAVLYEGYILWPYRRSARKNQRRWTFGGVYPRAFSEAGGGSDPWRMQTQCLVLGGDPVVDVRVRFLHVVERRVARRASDGSLQFVDELRIGTERFLAWDEARERQVSLTGVRLADLEHPHSMPIAIAAGREEEPLIVRSGEPRGLLVRNWRGLTGSIGVRAEPVQPDLFKLTVAIANTAEWSSADREETLRQTFVSTHTILTVANGEFVSLMDPPPELKAFAETCENIKTWPVLAGEDGDRHTLLSSPIILYDYPRIAPESPGDLFDAGEIDQLLTLNILTLSDEEKEEVRATDPRVRHILERTENLTAEDFSALHGTIRELRKLREEGPVDPLFNQVERRVPAKVMVHGVEVARGSRVRLRPRSGGDIMDVALAGKVAVVEGIEQDYDERIHLAVTVEEDPGRDLGEARLIGHRFFFAPEEIEPLAGKLEFAPDEIEPLAGEVAFSPDDVESL